MLGIHLTLLVGPTVAVPAPAFMTEALDNIEVTHSDEGRSGFQLTFTAGRRSGVIDALDYRLLSTPLLRPFNRVILTLTIGPLPRVLMDGVITHQELTPSNDPGASTLTVTGEDVSLMMDLHERSVEHPAQDETLIVAKLIGLYARFRLAPLVIPPPTIDPPLPVERTPVQQGTDLAYLQDLAQRHGYVFYVLPGPLPGQSTAYWGPPIRAGLPQKALSVAMGPATNVESINFSYDALKPEFVQGQTQLPFVGTSIPVRSFGSTRIPLSSQPAWAVNQPNVRTRQFRQSGLNAAQALARSQAQTDASVDSTITANVEVDTLHYGDVLQARALVGVRGVGYAYNGAYYVKDVTFTLRQGEFKQRATLTREGVGALAPVVRP